MIVYQHRIYRSDLQNNPDVFYLFGDNLLRVGMGGQAREMRGEPNAIGVATKKLPSATTEDAYFTDDEYDQNIKSILNDLEKVGEALLDFPSPLVVIVPSDGLGTGLSRMPEKCPKTFEFLASLGLGGIKNN